MILLTFSKVSNLFLISKAFLVSKFVILSGISCALLDNPPVGLLVIISLLSNWINRILLGGSFTLITVILNVLLRVNPWGSEAVIITFIQLRPFGPSAFNGFFVINCGGYVSFLIVKYLSSLLIENNIFYFSGSIE